MAECIETSSVCIFVFSSVTKNMKIPHVERIKWKEGERGRRRNLTPPSHDAEYTAPQHFRRLNTEQFTPAESRKSLRLGEVWWYYSGDRSSPIVNRRPRVADVKRERD